jgi:hypothetical protein
MNADEARWCNPATKAGRLRRAVLDVLRVHDTDGTLPTSARFVFYELVQAGVIGKAATGVRRADQDMSDALTTLREVGLVPWAWIIDETRDIAWWETAASIGAYVYAQIERAALDPWGGAPAPLILCESRSLAGALRPTAARYAAPIAATNGQARGFLVTAVAPHLADGQHVLYLGDWDFAGRDIERHSRATLEAHSGATLAWERVALTREQVDGYDLPVIQKPDRRHKPARSFDSVETEALGQARMVGLVDDRLAQLLPEPLDAVQVRAEGQRAEVAARLAGLLGDE